jgi:hypothetical protein
MKYPILLLLFMVLQHVISAQDISQISKEKPWTWTGAVGANTNFYQVRGLPPRSNPFFYNLHAQFTGRVYGFELPFSFTYGQHNLAINRPFLQAGMSPSYKWIKLHLGTRNMFFSNYTLAGHTFDGVGIELTPGKWRISGMAGNFRRARVFQEDLDPRFYNYLYRRSGHALRLGYGTESSFIDISYLQGRDIPNSIDFLVPETAVTPSRNHVLGLNTGLQLGTSVHLFAEGAVSLFTRNMNSIPSEDFPTPRLAKALGVTISSRINYAYRVGMDFKLQKFKLRAAYERIMPEFETMGAFFFVNDRQNITIAPSFTLFKNRMNINGNVGLQRNNLLQNRSETTSRVIGSFNMNYFHPKGWGVNFNYTNFSTEQVQAAIALSDSVRLALVTTNISLTPTYSWYNEQMVNALSASANHQQVNDRNPFTREFTNMTTNFITINHSLQWTASQWGINSGLNYNVIDLAVFSTTRYGATLGTQKSSQSGKFNISVNGNYNLSLIESQLDGSTKTINANVSYAAGKRHSFTLFVNFLRNDSKQFDDYTEWLGGLSYLYRIR